MLIDLHTHTEPLSHDSLLSPDRLIELAKAVVDQALEVPCVNPASFFVERQLAVVLEHGSMRAQHAAQSVHCNGHISTCEIRFGIRP